MRAIESVDYVLLGICRNTKRSFNCSSPAPSLWSLHRSLRTASRLYHYRSAPHPTTAPPQNNGAIDAAGPWTRQVAAN
jgi:hypothetical protein